MISSIFFSSTLFSRKSLQRSLYTKHTSGTSKAYSMMPFFTMFKLVIGGRHRRKVKQMIISKEKNRWYVLEERGIVKDGRG